MQSLASTESAPGAVSIAGSALRAIADEAIRSFDGKETGGVLLGFEGDCLEVRHAGGPGPGAMRQVDRFLRDLQHAQDLARAAWEEDRSQWIGEWHTHLDGSLEPSAADIHSYLQHLRDPELQMDKFLAIIVSVVGEELRIAAWIVLPGTAYLVPLDVVRED